jgi:DDE superfamily endonuclease
VAHAQKNDLKPWLVKSWCIPKVSAEFVWRMEDVLDLYAEPYDPQRPVVCFDEASKQLVAEVQPSLPPEPGQLTRQDYESRRCGTANIFLVIEPLAGWRHVTVTAHRTAVDFATQMQVLVDVHYPAAEVIRVVLDNLNTHPPAALYEAFEPTEAKRIADRLEFHYTPKQGRWLNMAESELSVVNRQCLDRRIESRERLAHEIGAWEEPRNTAQVKIHWCFRVENARTKLKRRYPVKTPETDH